MAPRRPAAKATWSARTPWGDPDLQGEWTSEGEYGVPFERPAQFGTRQFLTDAEYAKRIDDVRVRDERDLARVDVLSGKVDGPNAPIPHWREYNTTSRRTSLVIDPPDGRLPPRTPQARPVPVAAMRQPAARRAVRLVRGLRPRRPLHRARRRVSRRDVPRGLQRQHAHPPEPGLRRHHLRADSRYARHPDRSVAAPDALSPALRMYMGNARGRWEGTTLVVETSNLKANTRGASPGLRLIERFTRTGRDAMRLSGHVHRSGDVDRAVDRGARPEGAAGRCRRVRVRVSRGQLRHVEHALGRRGCTIADEGSSEHDQEIGRRSPAGSRRRLAARGGPDHHHRRDAPSGKVSPLFYGLMTEEINHAYDGGLYAELIQNRAFLDDAAAPAHWSTVQRDGAAATIALDRSQPLNQSIPDQPAPRRDAGVSRPQPPASPTTATGASRSSRTPAIARRSTPRRLPGSPARSPLPSRVKTARRCTRRPA